MTAVVLSIPQCSGVSGALAPSHADLVFRNRTLFVMAWSVIKCFHQ